MSMEISIFKKREPEPAAQIETITPEYAERLLSTNTNNRPLAVDRVLAFARAIERGEWRLNGDAIRLSKCGRLLDGQHRLSAVIKSGAAIESLVVRGLEEDVFDTIDTGAKRSPGQILSMLGAKHATASAAALRYFFLWTEYGTPLPVAHALRPTQSQIVDLFAEHPEVTIFARWVSKSGFCKSHMTPALSVFCLMAFSTKSEDDAWEFFKKLESGEMMASGDPVMSLRNRLISLRSKSARADTSEIASLTFKAFKMHINGQTSRSLRVSGTPKETFSL